MEQPGGVRTSCLSSMQGPSACQVNSLEKAAQRLQSSVACACRVNKLRHASYPCQEAVGEGEPVLGAEELWPVLSFSLRRLVMVSTEHWVRRQGLRDRSPRVISLTNLLADLKPENFLLTSKGQDGELKLTDFGLGGCGAMSFLKFDI